MEAMMKHQRREVKVIAVVPEELRNGVYARLRLQGTTFKQWLNEKMETFMAETPLREGTDRAPQRQQNKRSKPSVSVED
jgi:hypothetical protein